MIDGEPATIQRSPLFCANIVKKDPGRASQNSLATAGTNFIKPGALNKVDPCTGCVSPKLICLRGNNRAMRNKRRRDMMGFDSGDDDMSYILVL